MVGVIYRRRNEVSVEQCDKGMIEERKRESDGTEKTKVLLTTQ